MNTNETTLDSQHVPFMRRCIELAKIASRRGNTPVGSVVVINGEIVGEGIEELPRGNSVTGHAEVFACQRAVDKTGSRRLLGATLYSTAEPCFMCSYVIRQCEVALVVYGLDTADIGGVTSVLPILVDESLASWMPAPQIVRGVLRDECERLKNLRD
jgi:tRNA(adenine34) deaminase